MKPYIHAKASVHKARGGEIEDYIGIHEFMDLSKAAFAKTPHRSVMHNAYGCYVVQAKFGAYRTNSHGKHFSPRDVAEWHCLEDMQTIPTVEMWAARTNPKLHAIENVPLEEMCDRASIVFCRDPMDFAEAFSLMDGTWGCFPDPRHRAILHHSLGIELLSSIYPDMREALEFHVTEEFGRIPTLADFVGGMSIEKWMGPTPEQARYMKERYA